MHANLVARLALAVFAAACVWSPEAADAQTGRVMFEGVRTGEKPQSKLFHFDGSWWAVVHAPGGMAIHEKSGNQWISRFVIGGSGKADVKLSGSKLLVLVAKSAPEFYEFSYDAPSRSWSLDPGFPVAVPVIPDAETLVLEEDSTGRLWYTGEGLGSVVAYFTTTSHQDWSTIPVVIESGVAEDDISALVAFGGNKIGVFWSDQNRDEFAFRVHDDADSPLAWAPKEVVYAGFRYADDHLNLAYDSLGRVYAVTKNDADEINVHRRDVAGSWTTVEDIAAFPGNRGIIMLSEADSTVCVMYSDQSTSPTRITYQTASMNDLAFGPATVFMASSVSDLDDVSGTKQLLPSGCLAAVARGGGHVWWNSFGDPSGGTLPAAPPSISATALSSPTRVDVSWAPTHTPEPQGYYVYRSVNEGPMLRLTPNLIPAMAISDPTPPDGTLCYSVSTVAAGVEGDLSAVASVVRGVPGTPMHVSVVAREIFVTPPNRDTHELTAVTPGTDRHGDTRKPAPLEDANQTHTESPDPPERTGASALELHRVVDIHWDPPAFGLAPTHYIVYRQIDAGPSVGVAVLPAASSSHVDFDAPLGTLCYSVSAVNGLGEGLVSTPKCADPFSAATSTPHERPHPEALVRGAGAAHASSLVATPNPFNPRTVVRFQLVDAAHVFLDVYDARGRRVTRLVDAARGPGEHRVSWDGTSEHGFALGSGVYWIQLQAGGRSERRRVVLLK